MSWPPTTHADVEQEVGLVRLPSGLLGYKGISIDPRECATIGLVSQYPYFARIEVPVTISVTNIEFQVQTAGATLTSGGNQVGLYTSSGSQIAVSADLTTEFGSTGEKIIPLSGGPFTVTGGTGVWIFAAIKCTGTTPIGMQGRVGDGIISGKLTGGARRAMYGTPTTGALPASVDFTGTTAHPITPFLALT